ncbi:outer membrane protein assembly factor BamB family protein [Humisphaera borealis]|uniref:PQQ-binding-like beta-propeller repeat protein n=1 Tax=Humisphaera borealis TaxID=2807512 RepID=A0A7M2X0R0_9BACT|nr:PQQ-binding-like beta-propeller repeat protein [Humisphaera borealis]QOV91283.1 PQQ-binding-like beta-propeller repeat protein [Humisphaera borealis]
MRVSRLCVLFGALLVSATVALAGGSWPQFRGPTLQGVADDKNLPVVLDEKTGVVWKTAVHGKAWSSPVVADGKVWVSTATPDGKKLSIIRLDAATGKVELDEVLFEVVNPQFCHAFNSYASPTPVIEGDRIYVTFGSPGTACLDAKSGKKIWERTDFVCNHFRGAGSSPILWQDRILLNYDGSDFQFVAALNKVTGATIWRTDRTADYKDIDPKTSKPKADGDFRKGFSTCRVVSMGGTEQLLSVGGKAAYGYDLATGKELWRMDFAPLGIESHTPAFTPVVGDGLIYLATGHGKGELLAIKTDGLKAGGTTGESQVAWRLKKNVPNRSSALLHDGLLYITDDSAIASCLDAKTGQEYWKERIGGKGFSASPMFADGRIYFFSEGGVVTTIEPGKTLKKLGEGEFADGFMNSPAIVDNAFILRTKTSVLRVQK